MPTYAQNESIYDQPTDVTESCVPILVPRSRLSAAIRVTAPLAVTATEAINIAVDAGVAALDAATLQAVVGTEPKRRGRPEAKAHEGQATQGGEA